jgi:hypothetical protein
LKKDNPSLRDHSRGRRVFYFPLYSKGLGGFHIDDRPLSTHLISIILQPFILCSTPDSLFSQDEVRSSSGWVIPVISRI